MTHVVAITGETAVSDLLQLHGAGITGAGARQLPAPGRAATPVPATRQIDALFFDVVEPY